MINSWAAFSSRVMDASRSSAVEFPVLSWSVWTPACPSVPSPAESAVPFCPDTSVSVPLFSPSEAASSPGNLSVSTTAPGVSASGSGLFKKDRIPNPAPVRQRTASTIPAATGAADRFLRLLLLLPPFRSNGIPLPGEALSSLPGRSFPLFLPPL